MLANVTPSPVDPVITARLLDLRIQEIGVREKILAELRSLNLGTRAARLLCERELGYSYVEMRAIMFSLGLILTSNKMSSADPVVHLKIEKLKHWRKTRSQIDDVPAFRVLSNRTLMAVAASDVDSKSELRKIEGIGPKKSDTFGDELLQLLREARVAQHPS